MEYPFISEWVKSDNIVNQVFYGDSDQDLQVAVSGFFFESSVLELTVSVADSFSLSDSILVETELRVETSDALSLSDDIYVYSGAAVATLVSRATGNFTAATTFFTADATSELDSEAASTAVSTTNLDSAAFTPGAITVDAICVKLASRIASPTGTFTATLRNSTGGLDVASVTINVSDIPSGGKGWLCFKIGSNLLLAATNYIIRVVCSATGGQVTLFRNATADNWSRQLVTTTGAAPAVNDKLIFVGEHTGAGTGTTFEITIDNDTTTSFGPTVSGGPPQGITINNRATVSFKTAGGAINGYLKWKGILAIYAGGTLNAGTSGVPMPSGYTATLEMDSVANVDTGIVVEGGTFNAYGLTKTVINTLLNTDEAAASTVIGVVATTGWLVSDELGFASTTRTNTQSEKKTILTVDSATQVTLTAGLTNAHSGTSPTQAEVINLTRNVKIRGISAALNGYVLIKGALGTTTWQYVEASNLGSGTVDKRGIDYQGTASCTTNLQYCAFRDFTHASAYGIHCSGGSDTGLTVSNNVFYRIGQCFFLRMGTSGTWTFSNNICILTDTNYIGIYLLDTGGTFTGNTIAGATGGGIWIDEAGAAITAFNNITVHSCSDRGIYLKTSFADGFTMSNLTVWRNSSYGLYFENAQYAGYTIDTLVAFGNATANIGYPSGGQHYYPIYKNITSNGDTTFATTYGFYFTQLAFAMVGMRLLTADFSTVAGIKTAHTSDIQFGNTNFAEVLGSMVKLGAPPTNVNSQILGTRICISEYQQTTGNHFALYKRGSLQADEDTVVFNTATPSWKGTPGSATIKACSPVKMYEVNNAETKVVSVYVRKSTSYNGGQPRLIVKANPSLGITSDTVIDTMVVAVDTWEQLTANAVTAAPRDGVIECYVDFDGTVGFVNVDDWA